MNCIDCAYFLHIKYPDEENGICRRYAPKPFLGEECVPVKQTWWPKVAVDDWCGEYKPGPRSSK
jgi:hypothetical protein